MLGIHRPFNDEIPFQSAGSDIDMPSCMFNRGGLVCNHRNGEENLCTSWPAHLTKPKTTILFRLNAGVQYTEERDIERKKVLDWLGIKGTNATSCDGSTEGALLRVALLKTIENTKGKRVYDRDIFFCACHVHPDDITVGQREGSFSLVENFRILGTVEMQRLPNSPVNFRPFTPPKFRHASPLAHALSTENDGLNAMLQRRSQTFQVIKTQYSSLETDLMRIQDEVQTLKNENFELHKANSNLLQELAESEDINKIDTAARKQYYQLETEAESNGGTLPWNLDTLQSIYVHKDVKVGLIF